MRLLSELFKAILAALPVIGIILLVWKLFPDALLASGADAASDSDRDAAIAEIAETILETTIDLHLFAAIVALAWAFHFGRSRVFDDQRARSKKPVWWVSLVLLLASAGWYFRYRYSEMQGLAEGWQNWLVLGVIAFLVLLSIGLVFWILTSGVSKAWMRPSVPAGVSAGPDAPFALRMSRLVRFIPPLHRRLVEIANKSRAQGGK